MVGHGGNGGGRHNVVRPHPAPERTNCLVANTELILEFIQKKLR